MKDAYEVLQQKEADLARVRHEIGSLQVVAPLLSVDARRPRCACRFQTIMNSCVQQEKAGPGGPARIRMDSA